MCLWKQTLAHSYLAPLLHTISRRNYSHRVLHGRFSSSVEGFLPCELQITAVHDRVFLQRLYSHMQPLLSYQFLLLLRRDSCNGA